MEPFELFNMMSNFFPIIFYDLRDKDSFEKSHIVKSVIVSEKEPSEFIEEICQGLKGKYSSSSGKHIVLVCSQNTANLFGLFTKAIESEYSSTNSPLHAAYSIKYIDYDAFYKLYLNCRIIIERGDGANRRMVNNYASEIIPGFLFLGDGLNATDVNHQLDLGITHILDISGSKISEEAAGTLGLQYKSIHIWDSEEEDIQQYFPDTNKFILDCKAAGGKVLVHCRAGISRSSSLVLAYLLHTNTYTGLKEALQFVVQQRPIVCPNVGFRQQLINEECRLNPDGAGSTLEELESIIVEYGKIWSLVETSVTNYDRTPIAVKPRSMDDLMADAYPTGPVVVKPKKPFLRRGQGSFNQ